MKDVISKLRTGNLGRSTRTPCVSAANQTCPCPTRVSKLIFPIPAKSTEYFPLSANEEFLNTIYPMIYKQKIFLYM